MPTDQLSPHPHDRHRRLYLPVKEVPRARCQEPFQVGTRMEPMCVTLLGLASIASTAHTRARTKGPHVARVLQRMATSRRCVVH